MGAPAPSALGAGTGVGARAEAAVGLRQSEAAVSARQRTGVEFFGETGWEGHHFSLENTGRMVSLL